MPSQKFPAFKLPDRELLAALRTICLQLPLTSPTYSLQLAEQGSNAQVQGADFDDNEFAKQLFASEAAILWRAGVQGQSQGQNYSVAVQRSATHDEVTLSFAEHPSIPQAHNLRFLSLVHTHLRAYARTAATEELFGRELSEFYAQREDVLGRLEALNARILESNEVYRLKLEAQTDEARRTLQQEYNGRAQQFSDDVRRREDALTNRDSELKQRETELDNRSSTHARRQIRQDVKKIIAERTASFHLSTDTTRKRVPVHALFLILIASSASLFVAALLGFLPLPAALPRWFSAVRLPLITAALAASIVFYIRWVDNWFRQHADEELRLKRLELDIDRASWVVEMALEWKSEKGGEIPSELIDRLSRNLFEIEPSRRVNHPSEDLASALLGASAGLSLNIPGIGEARVDRKGLNEFRKAAQREEKS
jgi:hypothetical protein